MMVIMLHLKKEAYSSVSSDIKAIETEYDDQSELMKQVVKLCKKIEPD